MSNPGVGMPCPVCKVSLVMSERQGVEIDYCPQCRGVWLDRGEMDKIIEKSLAEARPAAAAAPAQPVTPQQAPPQQGYPQQAYPPQPYPPQTYHEPYYHKRKKSFLEELFD